MQQFLRELLPPKIARGKRKRLYTTEIKTIGNIVLHLKTADRNIREELRPQLNRWPTDKWVQNKEQ